MGDIDELPERDMPDKAIAARPCGNNNRSESIATSFTLLENAWLARWKMRERFEDMSTGALEMVKRGLASTNSVQESGGDLTGLA